MPKLSNAMQTQPDASVEIVVGKSEIQNVTVIRIKGVINAMTSKQLEKDIFRLLTPESNKLVLNLQELDYISSSGLRTLLTATRKIESLNGKMLLCCLSKNVNLTIQNSGFSTFFLCETTEDRALHQFQE